MFTLKRHGTAFQALADQRAEISQLEQRLVDAEAETSRLNEENRRLQDAARDRERPTTSSTTETGQLLQVATELERIANDQKDAIKLAEKEAERVAARLRESVDECDRLRRSADRLTRDLAESKREVSEEWGSESEGRQQVAVPDGPLSVPNSAPNRYGYRERQRTYYGTERAVLELSIEKIGAVPYSVLNAPTGTVLVRH